MPSRIATIVVLVIGLVGSTLYAGDKKTVSFNQIGDISVRNIYLAPSLATADTCFVTDNQEITWRIDGWVIGLELYKSLMNPANNCPNPYPFTITAINMPMMFDAPTPITIAVDVEAVDNTTIPGCPVPGALLAVSSQWETQIPEAGMYNIWVPLDTPIIVNGPFFAGFYLGNVFDTAVHAAVLTDDFPVPCATYNIWDETIGWVDLGNNNIYNFPGRLAMETAGIPGGVSSPQLEILTPSDGDILYANQELWAWDNQVTNKIEYIMFEYSNGGSFMEIGRKFDGTSPLRDGVHSALIGTGFSLNWDFSSFSEGYYDLRVTLVDTSGSTQSQTINVYLEPTPPIATITSPGQGTAFCSPVDINMTSPDENLSIIEVQHRAVDMFVSLDISPFDQALVGDTDGDPEDGNYATNGEFGDYYSAPVAAAIAAKVWSDRGYPDLVRQGTAMMTSAEVAEKFAAVFNTQAFLGAYDEAVFAGLKQYSTARGGGFEFDLKRQPNYADLRTWVENDERVVMLGVGGNPGFWLIIDGFSAWQRTDSTYLVSVANPLTGTIESATWRDLTGYSEIKLSGVWHRADLMISMFATGWNVSRSMIGADLIGQDGWSVHWNPSGILDGTYHYLRSVGHDQDDHQGAYSVLVQHNCAAVYVPGDYDNDRVATMSDLFLLIEFITQAGPPPDGGAMRADCNCDNVVNIADIIYYMNYLYGTASPPCR
ncbi:MAG: hypothetical protein J7J98_04600 [candidate division Zixibacteria bacterium]|nr:hypothetical protein [candidate division Zixibacteria bacterium]